MAQGTAIINFGSFPGSTSASVTVTGQTGITANSLVEAWLLPTTTADHSSDEHLVEELKIIAGNIVAGTGFTIFGFADAAPAGRGAPLYGAWNIAWVWN